MEACGSSPRSVAPGRQDAAHTSKQTAFHPAWEVSLEKGQPLGSGPGFSSGDSKEGAAVLCSLFWANSQLFILASAMLTCPNSQ
ncbi:Inward Rectifier Potassium Channel 13 [Manis pentadactyla]|nr:Inward Rectifier Potassium Channel 13 [Manis pentadactyla]